MSAYLILRRHVRATTRDRESLAEWRKTFVVHAAWIVVVMRGTKELNEGLKATCHRNGNLTDAVLSGGCCILVRIRI